MQHPVQDLLTEITEATEFPELVRRLQRRVAEGEPAPGAVSISGLTPTAKTLYAALLQRALRRPLLYVVPSNREGEQALDLFETWTDLLAEPAPVFLPAHDIRPYQGLSPHPDITEKRALGLGKLAAYRAALVILPVASAVGRLQSPEFYRSLARRIQRHQEIHFEELLEHLETVGYTLQDPVEMPGQFAVRGGILDIFSPETRRPVRLELFGDEVESIREFDVNSQRSVAPVEGTTILPLTEFPLRRQLLAEVAARAGKPSDSWPSGPPFPGWEFLFPLVSPLSHSLVDLCPDAVLFLDEPTELQGEIERRWELLEAEYEQVQREGRPAASPDQFYLRWDQWLELWSRQPMVHAKELELSLPSSSEAASFHFGTRLSPRFHGNLPLCLAELRNLLEQQYRILLLTTGHGETERLAELFAEHRIPFHRAERHSKGDPSWPESFYGDPALAACWIGKGRAAHGVLIPAQRILILGNQDLFEAAIEAGPRPDAQRSKISTFLSDFRDWKPGDYVVHVEHGVGCYRGLKEIVHDGMPNEFMELEYLNGDRLYVPLTRLDL
ncbi:MAG: transcription-repair coupling factor, partial [Acidobacteria bacterium]|nr:transcription-repair coupling factor [Acidobacteriota bacterium]